MGTIHRREINAALLKELTIDCKNCCGLCCTALYFSKTEGFPENKEAGVPCLHLLEDFQCEIHKELYKKHMKGCLAYDCAGAGQKVTQIVYKGKKWKRDIESSEFSNQMFAVYHKVFRLHQMLGLLAEAKILTEAQAMQTEIEKLILENIRMTQKTPEEILLSDIDTYQDKVNQVLKEISRNLAKNTQQNGKKEYFGYHFKKADLSGKDFTMALLIASNLEECDLTGANFLGADLRDANVCGSNLSESVFLTQMQINAARGNQKTKLPQWLCYPSTWK